MKKKLLYIFSLLLFCAVCLIGCGGINLQDGPAKADPVYGNGGSVVVKGDYIYFANAFIDYNSIGRYENKYNEDSSKQIYGIYRAKLNDFGLISYNEDGVPQGAELLVPQVGGYQYSGLYICGDYLYYTSPYTGDNKNEDVKGLVTFDRVKLNGSEHQVIHTMTAYSSSCKYSISFIDDVTYITIFDTNSSLQVIKVNGGNITKYDGDNQSIFASGVESFATINQQDISNLTEVKDTSKYVYYTKKDGDFTTMYRKSLVDPSDKETVVISPTLDSLKVVEVKNNRVYYIQNNNLYSSTFEQDSVSTSYLNFEIVDDSTEGVVNYKILNDTIGSGAVDRGIVYVYKAGDSNYFVSIGNGQEEKFCFSKTKQITILNVNDNSIYFKVAEDESLYVYNVLSNTEVKLAANFNTSVLESVTMYDFDSERAFYYSTAENTNEKFKYLHMVSLNRDYSYENAEGDPVGKYIGVIEKTDKK